MKTKLILFVLLCFNLSWGQAEFNQSDSFVRTTISNPIPPFGSEIFRFKSGLVTQLDSGSAFDFSSSQWFALGRLTAGTQNFYGLRFQQPNKSLLMGYSSANPNNPRIEWVGNGINTGNLEFRVGTGFGSLGNPGTNTLVATMTKEGRTFFGATSNPNTTAQVTIENLGGNISGLTINSSSGLVGALKIINSNDTSRGVVLRSIGGESAIGIDCFSNAGENSIAIKAFAEGGDADAFGTGIFAKGPYFAGFFDGNVTVTGIFSAPSDKKLKENIKTENGMLAKLTQLKPVTYDYKKNADLNLAKGIQHGFIAQELAEVFPELTQDIAQPIFDKEGKIKSKLEFKSINYNGLISVLTAGLQELNDELISVKNELTILKVNSTTNKISNNNIFMEQNIPNPFTDQTTIRYKLPEGVFSAEIAVFDMTGKPIKTYVVSSSQNEITIKSSDIGKGLFIYSLVIGGRESITKKMIIR